MQFRNRILAGRSRFAWPPAAALLVAGCAGSADPPEVEGRMLHAPETFQGQLAASIDGGGALSITSSQGAECRGPYRQVTDDNGGEVGSDPGENGQATLICSDGRTGSVMFEVGSDQAVGTGMLGRDIVTLTINQ